MSLIPATAIPASSGDFTLDQSLRFEDGDSVYLSKTPASASNRRTFTFSVWFKRGNISYGAPHLFQPFTDVNNYDAIMINSSDQMIIKGQVSGSSSYNYTTNQKFRDTSAWYHIVVAFDTTNGTAGNRIRLYVNGTEVTSFATETNPSENLDTRYNLDVLHRVGANGSGGELYDGYMAEMHFIDGTALTPSSFGETGDYGEWKPKEVSGVTYGTNGFYLPFKQDYEVEGFSANVYTGTGAADNIVPGVGFSPDLVWIKNRTNGGYWGTIYDQIRGTEEALYPNDSSAESTISSTLTAFNTDGFTVGTNVGLNTDDNPHVAWCWDMGGSNASNTNGSITSTVRANTTYGQSIVSYTGTGSNATVGHGLSSAPEMMIIKRRSSSQSWFVYHDGIAADAQTDAIKLNSTAAAFDDDGAWNDTAPTNALFSLGSSGGVNQSSGTYIAYCFHSVTGYSSFGTYSGTGGTGNVTTVGFRPAFIMVKKSSGTGDWMIFDTARQPAPDANKTHKYLKANEPNAEYTAGDDAAVTITDTSFQMFGNIGNTNTNGQTYIYMAFADKREYAYWLDQSGNNNDWTSNNLTESDIMVDSPTNNFCTYNPLSSNEVSVLMEGNLKNYGTNNTATNATFGVTTGKWYWEVSWNADIATSTVSWNGVTSHSQENDGDTAPTMVGTAGRSVYRNKGTNTQYKDYTATSSTDDTDVDAGGIMGFRLDMDGGSLKYYRNNTLVHTDSTIPTDGTVIYPVAMNNNSGVARYNSRVANFGQDSSFAGTQTAQGNQDSNGIGDFYYEPPSGFLALCTSNLPAVAVTPSEHFNTVLYTANAGTNAITGVGFQPDLSWFKIRSSTGSPVLFDAIRGVNSGLASNQTAAEYIAASDKDLVSFDSDGFTLGAGEDWASVNQTNGTTHVAWNWKANGSGSSNTNGSINTTATSANVDAGFSIVTWVGNEGADETVGHGLSKAPEIIIAKVYSGLTGSWATYVKSLGNNKKLHLNGTDAVTTDTDVWAETTPTASVFSIGTDTETNWDGRSYVAYCFHSVDGYSKVGSYKGNGNNDGTFIYTGFRPKWVLIKESSHSGENWNIYDGVRDTYNYVSKALFPNTSGAETSGVSQSLDFVSNGFKIRYNNNHYNDSASTYIYLAFAETPFKYSNAR